MNRLQGKVAIITGGNAGIGEAIAKLFADEGAQVVVTGRRKEELDRVVKGIGVNGGRALAVAGSVTDEAHVREVVAQATRGDAIAPALQALFYPATDLTCSFPSHQRMADAFILGARAIAWYRGHYLGPDPSEARLRERRRVAIAAQMQEHGVVARGWRCCGPEQRDRQMPTGAQFATQRRDRVAAQPDLAAENAHQRHGWLRDRGRALFLIA